MDDIEPGPSKKRKGGQQQRMAREEAEKTEASALNYLLMTLLAQGVLSGVLCHKIAQAAVQDMQKVKDGKKMPDLEKVAKLKHGKNLVQGVYRSMADCSSLPRPFQVEMPFQDGAHTSSILLPHELFASMYEKPEFWRKSICGSDDCLESFWESFSKHPAFLGNPIQKVDNYRRTMVPLALHGDEVPVFGVGKIWARSALAFSWASLAANALGSTGEEVMIYCWGCFEKFTTATVGNTLGTLDVFWQVLQWSFLALFEGKWPSADWRGVKYNRTSPEGRKAGQPLAGKYRACLLQICGDLDYLTKWLQVPNSTNHSRPCCQCKCTFSGTQTWLDCREGSPWQSSLLTTRNWRQHWSPTCALFRLPGLSCWSVAYDLMHNAFLGWYQFLYGSILHILCFELLEMDALSNLKSIGAFIKEFQKGDPSRQKFRPLLNKLSMFQRQTGFPKLKGRAADIRGVDKAMKAVWEQYMDSTILQHQQIAVMLTLNVHIRDLLDQHSPKEGYLALPDDVRNCVVAEALQMVQLHSQLSDHYKAEGKQLFNLTSKTHFCIHTFMVSNAIHPYLTWCFKGEAKMKAVQQLWKSCLVGNKHFAVTNVAALKYRHLLTLSNL